MKLEQSFEVQAPLQRVWDALIDVEYVAPCLPGASITGLDDEGAYRGTFTIKLGPTTAAYNGVLRIDDIDEAAHKATLHARGTDKRGQGAADATIVNTLTEAGPATTRVEAVTDFTITGRMARFGRGGMIEDISNRLLREFAECLQAKLAAGEHEAAAPGAAAETPAGGSAAGAEAPAAEAQAPVAEAGAPAAEAGAPVAEAEAPVAASAASVPPDSRAPGGDDEAPAPVSPPSGEGGVPPSTVAPAPGATAEAPAPVSPSTGPPGGPAGPKPTPTPQAVTPQASPTAAPVRGFSLFFSVLWERVKRRVAEWRKAR